MSTCSTGRSEGEKGATVISGAVLPLLAKPDAACVMLQCSRPRLYELINSDEIESFRWGKSRLIVVASIHQFIARKLAAQGRAA